MKALFAAKKIIAQIITDVVNLEDINYTVPEVQTLLDGITVGGHKIQDELITLNQIRAWNFLFKSIENKSFMVSNQFVLELHALVASNEALEWGRFRTSGGSISGTSYIPPQSSELAVLWQRLENETNSALLNANLVDIYKAAINLFAKMAKIQFFYDGNKRTGRMMMSGVLLNHNLPMISVGAKRRLEFNQTMIKYYETEDFNLLYNFLISCLDDISIEEYNLHDLKKAFR